VAQLAEPVLSFVEGLKQGPLDFLSISTAGQAEGVGGNEVIEWYLAAFRINFQNEKA